MFVGIKTPAPEAKKKPVNTLGVWTMGCGWISLKDEQQLGVAFLYDKSGAVGNPCLTGQPEPKLGKNACSLRGSTSQTSWSFTIYSGKHILGVTVSHPTSAGMPSDAEVLELVSKIRDRWGVV